MKKIFLSTILLVNLSFTSFSQVVNIYKISPQHLAVNTFSVTWERASSSLSRTSLNISPFITYYDRQNDRHSYNYASYTDVSEKVAGAGLELGKKFYVSKNDSSSPLKGFYGSGSITYGFYSADYQRYDDSITNSFYGYNGYYNSYTSSGKFYHENIHKLGADIFIGYQLAIKKVFYTDVFFGAGMRYGISSLGDNGYFKSSLIDIGHSGIIPKFGVKLGLRL